MTTSRVVRSKAKVWAFGGNTSRIRLTASVTAAIFLASRALSTTRCRQDSRSAELFNRPEVQILEDGPRLPLHQGGAILDGELDSIAKDSVSECGRRLVQNDEVDGPARGTLQPGDQVPDFVRRKASARKNAHGHVHVTSDMILASSGGAEEQRVRHLGILFENLPHRGYHIIELSMIRR